MPATSMLAEIVGSDSGYVALVEKTNALIRHRSSLDFETKSAAYDVDILDQLVILDATAAGFTVTLPAAPTAGERHSWKVKSVAGGNVTIDGNGKNIDGAATKVLNAQYATLSIEFDSVEDKWWIL